jgi:hypothetical protein
MISPCWAPGMNVRAAPMQTRHGEPPPFHRRAVSRLPLMSAINAALPYIFQHASEAVRHRLSG